MRTCETEALMGRITAQNVYFKTLYISQLHAVVLKNDSVKSKKFAWYVNGNLSGELSKFPYETQ